MQAKGKVKENTQDKTGKAQNSTGEGEEREEGSGERKSIDEQPQNGWHNKWATGFRFACLLEARLQQRGVPGEYEQGREVGESGSKLLPKLRLPRMWTVINELSAVPDKSGIH